MAFRFRLVCFMVSELHCILLIFRKTSTNYPNITFQFPIIYEEVSYKLAHNVLQAWSVAGFRQRVKSAGMMLISVHIFSVIQYQQCFKACCWVLACLILITPICLNNYVLSMYCQLFCPFFNWYYVYRIRVVSCRLCN